MNSAICFVCNELNDEENVHHHGRYEVDCSRCGRYSINEDTAEDLVGTFFKNDPQMAPLIGHDLHRQRRLNGTAEVEISRVERLKKERWLPSLAEQRDNALRIMGDAANVPGKAINLDCHTDQFAIGAVQPEGVMAIIDNLSDVGCLTPGKWAMDGHTTRSVTFDGWLAYEEIKRSTNSGDKVFMAMPFNEPDLEDHWLPKIREAVSDTGFHLERLDDNPQPGIIDVRMRVAIKEARFTIVELTHANRGAYWEAGFAEGLDKPVIYTCRAGEDVHFDADHLTRIQWEPDNLDLAADQLRAMIRDLLPDAKRAR